ncbi:MAG: GNAT family N-acetyltransferase, partial [Acidimicrobiia bacterium]
MVGRPYDAERDLAAVTRMWREIGWIDGSDPQASALEVLLAQGEGLVADVHGEAECLVHRVQGSLRYGQDRDLPLTAITAVTTSHVARRQGVATALMLATLDAAAGEGAAVVSLGIFEQGFYDRFGFGTGAYEHRFAFDPATLRVPVPGRAPLRLTADDAGDMYELLRRRHRGHGSVVLDAPDWMAVEWRLVDKPFALGYRAADGRLTHFLMGSATADHGPYDIEWLVFEEPDQLLELLGVLRMLGDQVNRVTIKGEPAGVQLQDLVREPVRQRRTARLAGGSAEAMHHAAGIQQDRILDLTACVGAVRLVTPPLA